MQEVLVELNRQNQAKQDFISPAQGMRLREDGHTFEINHLTTSQQEVFGTTSLFHRQVASALGIKSSTDIRDWNAGNIPVALIHPASAGHGLNIQQGGHILIWFGLTWSLELYQQTNARLWRQGQTDVVTIHHIITKDTVDEDVMAALEQKDMTQEKLISAVKAQLGR
mgnify:CR=1 FL=1